MVGCPGFGAFVLGISGLRGYSFSPIFVESKTRTSHGRGGTERKRLDARRGEVGRGGTEAERSGAPRARPLVFDVQNKKYMSWVPCPGCFCGSTKVPIRSKPVESKAWTANGRSEAGTAGPGGARRVGAERGGSGARRRGAIRPGDDLSFRTPEQNAIIRDFFSEARSY